MMEPPVLFDEPEARNGKRLGVMTFNVEKKLHSLTVEMVDLIHHRLARWQDDAAVACILVKGAGDRAFCAGADVLALYRSATERPGGPCLYAETFFEHEYRMDYRFHTCEKPVIAWGNGIVMGGGLGIFAGCNHRVVTETTRLAMPEVTISLYPDVGGGWFLNRMPGRTGLFLALTGSSFNAADGLYLGIADHFIPHEALGSVMAALFDQPWTDTLGDNHAIVGVLLSAMADPARGSLPAGRVATHRATIETLCEGKDVVSVTDAILKGKTSDSWLSSCRENLAHGSPLSAVSSYRHLQQCRPLTLKQVLQAELPLSTNVVRDPEFAEGVRALLIDKDKTPRWRFPSIAAVSEESVERLFRPPWPKNPLADL